MMGSNCRIAVLMAGLSLLLGSSGCASPRSLSNLALLIAADPMEAEQLSDTPEQPMTVTVIDPETSEDISLDWSEFKPGQQVCLLMQPPAQTRSESHDVPQTVSFFEFLGAHKKTYGTVVSVDSSQIVLRDIIITSDRDTNPRRSRPRVISKILPRSEHREIDRRYLDVPGQLIIPRHEIRLAQAVTKRELSALQRGVEDQERMEYTLFDMNISD